MSAANRRLAGKVVLVTGGAQLMGTNHVRMMIDEGASVVIGDVAEEAGEARASEWPDACLFARLDVNDEEQWHSATKSIPMDQRGPLWRAPWRKGWDSN